MSLASSLWLVGLAALPISARALDGADAPAAPAEIVKQLGDEDYQTRKAAYRALEKLGASARAELEKAAKSDDPEVRWSASLLLDRLDESNQPTRGMHDDPLAPAPQKGQGGARTRGRFDDSFHRSIEEMHDSIRRMFGEEFGKGLLDGTMHRFGDEELFGEDGPFGRFGVQGGQGGHGLLELGPGSSFSRTFDNNGQRESTSIQVGPDGRVKVQQEKHGEKTSIEAESLDALRKEHPELMDGLGDGPLRGGVGGMSFRFGRDAPQPQAPLLPQPRARSRNRLEKPAPQQDPLLEQDDAAPAPPELPAPDDAPDRPRLGVQVAPVKADVAEYLELEPGVGLEIVRVVPGSAADKIGVKARDILTEVNGRAIRGPDDVATALAGRDPATAEVIVIRRGAEKPLVPRK